MNEEIEIPPEIILSKVNDYLNNKSNMDAFNLIYEYFISNMVVKWSQNLDELIKIFLKLSNEFNLQKYNNEIINIYKSVVLYTNPFSIENICKIYSEMNMNKFNDSIKDLDFKPQNFLHTVDLEQKSEFINLKQFTEKEILLRSNWKNLTNMFFLFFEISCSQPKLLNMYFLYCDKFLVILNEYESKQNWIKFTNMIKSHQNRFIKNQNIKLDVVLEKFLVLNMTLLKVNSKFNLSNSSLKILFNINQLLKLYKKNTNPYYTLFYKVLKDIFYDLNYQYFHFYANINYLNFLITNNININEIKAISNEIILSFYQIKQNSGEFELKNNNLKKFLQLLNIDTTYLTKNMAYKVFTQSKALNFISKEIKLLHSFFNKDININKSEEIIKNKLLYGKYYDNLFSNIILWVLNYIKIANDEVEFEELKSYFKNIDFDNILIILDDMYSDTFNLDFENSKIIFLEKNNLYNNDCLFKIKNDLTSIYNKINTDSNFNNTNLNKEIEKEIINYNENKEENFNKITQYVKDFDEEENEQKNAIKKLIDEKLNSNNYQINLDDDMHYKIKQQKIEVLKEEIYKITLKDPNASFYNLKLKDLNDEEIAELDDEVIDMIHRNLYKKKIKENDNKLDDKMEKILFKQRYYNEKFNEESLNNFQSNNINIDKIQEEWQNETKNKKELKEKLSKSKKFKDDYINKLYDVEKVKFEEKTKEDRNQYKKKLQIALMDILMNFYEEGLEIFENNNNKTIFDKIDSNEPVKEIGIAQRGLKFNKNQDTSNVGSDLNQKSKNFNTTTDSSEGNLAMRGANKKENTKEFETNEPIKNESAILAKRGLAPKKDIKENVEPKVNPENQGLAMRGGPKLANTNKNVNSNLKIADKLKIKPEKDIEISKRGQLLKGPPKNIDKELEKPKRSNLIIDQPKKELISNNQPKPINRFREPKNDKGPIKEKEPKKTGGRSLI